MENARRATLIRHSVLLGGFGQSSFPVDLGIKIACIWKNVCKNKTFAKELTARRDACFRALLVFRRKLPYHFVLVFLATLRSSTRAPV